MWKRVQNEVYDLYLNNSRCRKKGGLSGGRRSDSDYVTSHFLFRERSKTLKNLFMKLILSHLSYS